MSAVAFVVVVLVVVLAIVLAGLAVRIVPEYQRLVVLRLGRLVGVRGPGLVLLIPFIDRGIRTDLRERVFDVMPQACITQDNASLAIDFLIYPAMGPGLRRRPRERRRLPQPRRAVRPGDPRLHRLRLLLVDVSAGNGLFRPVHQVRADVAAIARQGARYPVLPDAVEIADAPVQLLQRVLSCVLVRHGIGSIGAAAGHTALLSSLCR